MRRSVALLGCVVGLAAMPPLAAGCGGDSKSSGDQGTGGSLDDGGGDVSQADPDGSTVDVKSDCALPGATCAGHSDCCSASCDPDTHVCVNPVVACKAAGESCGAATECCTTVCSGGKCGNAVCTPDGNVCLADDECCSGVCGADADGGMACTPLNSACSTVGNPCTSHDACCSHYCDNGRCSSTPSFCTQTGDACAKDAECCAGICSIASGATVGICTLPSAPGATNCKLAGEVCGAGASGADGELPTCGGECCSRACAPWAPTGVLICQPPSGCRPTGEACNDDSDCCGSAENPGGGDGSVVCSKAPGEAVGRCDNGNACRPAGAVCKLATTSCNAENNCCAGNVNKDPTACQQDLLGIPRCTAVGNCADAGSLEGHECSTSADCCGLPCLPNADPNGPPFICGTSCVPSGGACTTNADCCAGLPCILQPGASKGVCELQQLDGGVPEGGVPEGGVPDAGVPDGSTCALYGQSCETTADCCGGIPCTNGRCVISVF